MSAILLTSTDPHPPDCPAFNYESDPRRGTLLGARVDEILIALLRGDIDTRNSVLDTRPLHHRLFVGLTPVNCDYYAGHYRGEPFRCLQHYRVMVPSDPRVGSPPVAVQHNLTELASIIRSGLDALEGGPPLSGRDRLRYLIVFACRAFEIFLRVHPYANGNGHAARLMIWCVLGRYGHWPRRWTVEPRPPDPPYSDLIRRYRDGDKNPLELFVASMLVP